MRTHLHGRACGQSRARPWVVVVVAFASAAGASPAFIESTSELDDGKPATAMWNLVDDSGATVWCSQRQSAGNDLPFAVIDLKSGQPVGATRYMTIERGNRSLEIGGTWYGAAHRRTPVNTESKYLLLGHAFDRLGCVRVQFRTDLRNERSQKAIERLGASREAVFRKHLRMPDGYQRSSVIYSLLDDEWPQVKVRLEKLLHEP